jgi:Tol biopolymer transport system component
MAASTAPSRRVVACLLCVMLTLSLMVMLRPALAQNAGVSAGVRLEAGIEKEDVDGDLKSAMDIYEKIAVDTSAPRDVRAKALLRLAGCDEKLGKQAKQIYEQILHEYADQPAAAAQARKRLALIRQQLHPAPPATMSLRKIEWASIASVGSGDTDGARAVYWSEGHLYFGDLAGHSRHLIGDFTHLGTIPSRDFSMVALNLKTTPIRPHTLAVIKTDGTGYRELIREDVANSIFRLTSSLCLTWSWDDKFVLVSDLRLGTNLEGQVWIVSVADGNRRVLADQKDGIAVKAVFSPDGKFVAYEAWPRDDLGNQTSRVYVVSVQGGEPLMVFESARWTPGRGVLSLVDWTADGRYLALHDVRHGKSALFLLPMKAGAADGEAAFLRYGDFEEGYSTAAGALVVQDNMLRPGKLNILIASIDSDGNLGTWKSLSLNTPLYVYKDPRPSFSPDGRQVAYVGGGPDPTRSSLVVLDIATGRDREIYQSAYGSLVCQYSMRSPRVYCSVEKEGGESELLSVEVESGAVEHIANFPKTRYLVRCGRDDETFYFSPNGWRWRTSEPPIIEWNRSTAQETVIIKDGEYIQMSSPDGRSIVGLQDGTLSVGPTSGGEWEPLVSGIRLSRPLTISPDGNWVYYQDQDATGKASFFRVSTAGGQPKRVGGPPGKDYFRDFFFSPDGRQMLILDNRPADLWLLENFEPPPKK